MSDYLESKRRLLRYWDTGYPTEFEEARYPEDYASVLARRAADYLLVLGRLNTDA